MKKIIAMVLVLVCMCSLFVTMASAELKTGSEKFEGISKSQKDQQAVAEIYEDLIYRAYEFDEDILLPELKHMNDLDDIKIKYVQGKRGFARAQSIYLGPDDSEAAPRYAVKDGNKVMVYAKYKDYSFVEIMMNDKESEGTIGWIPTTYLTDNWSMAVSRNRGNMVG